MAERAQKSPRFLVVGCGGIGGIIAAHLLEQGHSVDILSSNPEITAAVNTRGMVVQGDSSPGTVRGIAFSSVPKDSEPYDYILLATQPPQVESATREVAPFLAPQGTAVVLQNGLCELRIAEIVGSDRTIGGVVAFGASMIEPGVFDRTSGGGFVLGHLDGRIDESLEVLARALESVGPVSITQNLAGARWSKLAMNAAISSLGTVGGDRLGPLMRHRFARRLGLEVVSETVAVARAKGVRLEKVAGTVDLEWLALTDSERRAGGSASLVAKHGLLLALGARYRRLRSSMLAAIERGRPPSVDFLNGEVVSHGERHGIPTPVNREVQRTIHASSRGEMPPSVNTLRDLFERVQPSGE